MKSKILMLMLALLFATLIISGCSLLDEKKSNPLESKDNSPMITEEGRLPGIPPAEYPDAPPIPSEEEIINALKEGRPKIADVCGIPSWAILEQAYLWLGVNYVYGGNSHNGIDCSHLVYQVYGGACISYPYFTVSQMKASWRFICVNPVAGDVILFRNLTHFGIYVGNGWMIDANSYYGRVRYDYIWDSYWSSYRPYGVRFTG